MGTYLFQEEQILSVCVILSLNKNLDIPCDNSHEADPG